MPWDSLGVDPQTDYREFREIQGDCIEPCVGRDSGFCSKCEG